MVTTVELTAVDRALLIAQAASCSSRLVTNLMSEDYRGPKENAG
jgi:hypothetical protein